MVKLFKRNPLDLTGFQHVVDGVLQYANGLYQSHAFHLAGCGIHVASTAHTLHDDLYIDLINGSGADIDLALIIRKLPQTETDRTPALRNMTRETCGAIS